MYACSWGAGIGVRHHWNPVTIQDMVCWTAVPIQHGALEGSPGMLNRQWNKADPRHDFVIANNISHSHWLHIKRYFKLNLNKYITWRYWQSLYLHAMSLGVIACYDMYRECCDGDLDPSWRVPAEKDRMLFADFRLKLSEQMLTYDPQKNKYAGDSKFRDYTNNNKRRWSALSIASEEKFPDIGVTVDNLAQGCLHGRFFDPGKQIQDHFENIQKTSNAGFCEVCGIKCYWKCKMYNKMMCVMPNRLWDCMKSAFRYHSEEFEV